VHGGLERGRTRLMMRRSVALDHSRSHSVARQLERGEQARRPGAENQDAVVSWRAQ
jgi:hypothetical protein